MNLMRSSLFISMFFLGTVLSVTVYSEDDSDSALQTTDLVEIIIESDSFVLKPKEKTVVFKENVTARVFKENVTAQREDLTIECDEILVYYYESENGDVDFDKIMATGNVGITRADGSSGTAEKAVFDLAEETVVMTGQPALKQGKNSYKGSSLTYHLRDGTVEGTDVKVVLHRKKEEGVSTGGE